MTYKEEHRDLFSVPKDYALCHCISSDFALGAGIAAEFAKRGVKNELIKTHGNKALWFGEGYALTTNATDFKREINLITKEHYWDKPTNETLRGALIATKTLIILNPDITRIAMPKIGCGLDKLRWEDVLAIIKEIFEDTDIEILVCIK